MTNLIQTTSILDKYNQVSLNQQSIYEDLHDYFIKEDIISSVDNDIVIRSIMYLAFSYDHRLIDGKEAVGFLVSIKESLENPSELVLGF